MNTFQQKIVNFLKNYNNGYVLGNNPKFIIDHTQINTITYEDNKIKFYAGNPMYDGTLLEDDWEEIIPNNKHEYNYWLQIVLTILNLN